MEADMSGIIYLLTNTLNGKQYIGQTICGLDARWKQHCRSARRGSKNYIHRAIRKYGTVVFNQQIIEETNLESLDSREIYWISMLNPEYNMTNGGGGVYGYKHSKEALAKISAALSGIKSPNYGKSLPENTKNKISAALSGENSPNYGKKFSEETKAKMSASRTGEKHPNYGKSLSVETKAKISESIRIRNRMKRIFAPIITIKLQ